MPDNFSHVANSILRRTLEASPRQVRTEELRQALTMTVESLVHAAGAIRLRREEKACRVTTAGPISLTVIAVPGCTVD